MNERIRELAEQTGLIPKTFGPVVQTRHMKKKEQDLEKFAELIVQECAMEAIDEVAFQGGSVAIEAGIRQRLYTHFGVEE